MTSNYLGLPAGFANDSPFPPLQRPDHGRQQPASFAPQQGGSRPRPQPTHYNNGARPSYPSGQQPYAHGAHVYGGPAGGNVQPQFNNSPGQIFRHESQQQPFSNGYGAPPPPPPQQQRPHADGQERMTVHHPHPESHRAGSSMGPPSPAPQYRPSQSSQFRQAPPPQRPVAMPMPQPYMPSTPVMAQSPRLGGGSGFGRPSPPQAVPSRQAQRVASPAPHQPQHSSEMQSLSSGMSQMMNGNEQDIRRPSSAVGQSVRSQLRASSMERRSGSRASGGSSDIAAHRPDLADLSSMRDDAFASRNNHQILTWCREVLRFVERNHESKTISEPTLVTHIDEALRTIGRLASATPPIAEALYIRGDLQSSGAFPSYHAKDLKAAFNDFELSARMGHAASWYRVGRDYELLKDLQHARDAYERGCSIQDVGCIYRMGMANLLGQLELTVDYDMAMPLLQEAADLSSIDTPQPSYVYGMLLIGEFNGIKIPKHLLNPAPDPKRPDLQPTIEGDARRRIQRSAYLHMPQAQHRCGTHYEYALLECVFDPLLSVQYYSLASQGGEAEADLALSKWFLCGAEGCFEKNEKLAFTFAEKGAQKGLASAEFAMGYYYEVGVGCQQSIETARKWYARAAKNGNTDARERLNALDEAASNSYSRQQHESHVDKQLQRKRTEAKVKSDKRRQQKQFHNPHGDRERPDVLSTSSPGPPAMPGAFGEGLQPPTMQRQSAELQRNATMRLVESLAYNGPRRTSQSSIESMREPPPPRGSPRVDVPLASSPRPMTPTPPRMPPQGTPQQVASPRLGVEAAGGAPRPSSRQGHDRTPPKAPSTPQSSRPPASIVMDAYGGPSGRVGATAPAPGAPAGGAQPHVYETFSEMGIKSSKASSDRDCIIM